jgi:hypothetical protein
MSNGQRLDAIMARKYTDRDGNEKSAFTRLGTAFPITNGGYSIVLDAMPAPEAAQNGGLQYRLLLMVPKPRDGEANRSGSSDERSGGTAAEYRDKQVTGGSNARFDDSDEIPFAPEWRA